MSTADSIGGPSFSTHSQPPTPEQSGPSIIQRLQERAEQRLNHYAREEEEKERAAQNRKQRRLLGGRFRLRRDSQDAVDKVRRLSRAEKKKAKEELKRLSKLSERELKIYQMLSDPNN